MNIVKPHFIATALAASVAWSSSTLAEPKLVLQITVDQLRADMPQMVKEHWGKKGFRWLYENGLVYANAHHAHANTETIVGHTTLATGATPAVHGMVGNIWYDRELGRAVYNIEDPDYALLSADADVDDANEIDPTQRAANSDGRSPRAIRSSTLSDQIALAGRGRAKIFGVSVKDRGAVAMAGHAGKAFWFSKAAGEFVTSNYYYERYPQWVLDWNAATKHTKWSGSSWTLSLDENAYSAVDDAAWETNFPGYGITFPHSYGSSDSKYFTTLLTLSPAGDELTADFAMALIDAEAIGKDDVTDYLSVSFSSTDYVGHLFGPASREAEDNLIRLDRTLEKLLEHVDKTIGLRNVVVVLSADHGAADVAGYLQSLNIPAGNINLSDFPDDSVNARLTARFGVGSELISAIEWPYLSLNHDLIAEQGLNSVEVAEAIAAELESIPGIFDALTTREMNAVDKADYVKFAANNYAEGRSGDIHLVVNPHWFVADFDGLSVASTHGSPWAYDRHVPIIFVGKGIPAARVDRAVSTTDVAPTVSALLNIGAPSGTTGHVLTEAIR